MRAREYPSRSHAGAEHYVVADAGHSFFVEKPDEVNGVLIDFFTR
jgi:pimeloyl-ACP methyl ester carboxylesterase